MDALQWFWLFIVSYALWVIVACVSLLLERRSPTATLAWIFAFVAIPVVSGIYYLMFGPRRLHRRRRRYSVARRSVSRNVSGDDDGPARPQLGPDAAGLAAVARRLEQGDATFASAVTLLRGQTAPPAARGRASQPPLVRSGVTVKLSAHVYVIPDGNVPMVPNVGIVVGSKATLVIDTGLGPNNAKTVLSEVAKVSRNRTMYLVATHFHPEHAAGVAQAAARQPVPGGQPDRV